MIDKLIPAEIHLINIMLEAHDIHARTRAKLTMCARSSFIAYGLEIAKGETVSKIERIQRELSNELTRQRVRMLSGYSGKAVVRLRDYPLAIEVPHPAPVPLSWQRAPLRTGRLHALIGRSYSYNGVRDEWLDLERHYHTLVAAQSGGGKSTLMRMALISLTHNTAPDLLQIMLVDLKNDDLVPFRDLPHVINYAGDIESAAAAIEYVHQVKTERIASQDKPFRLLLVIDELAELGSDKDALKLLGSILSTGRSLGINVWAGTQYPSAQAIGALVAASFTTRLVGMVDGKTSALVASKRANSGAELLCTPGDFLRIDGGDLVRMKAYDLSQEDSTALIRQIGAKSKRTDQAHITIKPKRTKMDGYADLIAEMYAAGASKNAMCKHVFGRPYAGSFAAKIDAAIEVIQSRLATKGSTTPASTDSTHTREEDSEDRSSRSNKIIKFPRKAG